MPPSLRPTKESVRNLGESLEPAALIEDLSARKAPLSTLEKTSVTHRHIRTSSPESVQDELENEVRTGLALRPPSRRIGRDPIETPAQSWSKA